MLYSPDSINIILQNYVFDERMLVEYLLQLYIRRQVETQACTYIYPVEAGQKQILHIPRHASVCVYEFIDVSGM